MNKKALIISLVVFFSIIGLIIGSIFLVITNVDPNGFNLNYEISKDIILEEEYELDFEKINVDTNTAKIEIKNSDSKKLKVIIYSDQENVKITKEENLIIKSKKLKRCKFICINKVVPKIVIYLPTKFDKKINIKNDFGDIKINKVDKIYIKNDLGNIKIKKANIIKIDNNLGDIKINSINKSLNIKNNLGDIKIKKLNITKDSLIENNLGSVKINDINEIYIESNVDLGESKIKNNNRKADVILKINSNIGDVEVGN